MSAPAIDNQDTPPIPEGSVMVTLKIARYNPDDPDCRRIPELPGAVPAQ